MGASPLTRDEAEWLFDLDTAAKGYAHVTGWRDLFVSAIMNHLFAAGPSDRLERGAMLRRTAWLKAPEQGIGAFFARAFEGGL